MQKRTWPVLPITLLLLGMSIGLDPDGRVLQMQFGFGQYRHEAATAFIILGVIAFLLLQKSRRDGT
jgi:hypothetical protein